jgi:uncharacterized repeat protein (TIGR01451 family)
MKGVRLKALGVALLGALALMFAGCGQQGGGSQAPTKGSLTVNVIPADAQVQVTGPGSFSQSFTGGKTLTDLDPGDYTVQASKAGYFTASATHKVEAGKITPVVLSLLPVPASGPTEGKVAVLVVNGNGSPISGATVSDGTNTATTDAQGRADLTYTAAGTYAISVNAAGYLGAAQLASVELGKTVALTFKLQPQPAPAPTTGTLVVHVYGADTGQTLSGSSVVSNPALTFSGSGGLFTATADPGTYAVTASALGYLSGSRAANVEAGKTTVLNIGLQRNTASGPVGNIEIVSVKDQWGADLPVRQEVNPAKDVNLYASQTEEPVCVTVRVTRDGQPVQNARVRVSALGLGQYLAEHVHLSPGCVTAPTNELDFVMTDSQGIAKFTIYSVGDDGLIDDIFFLVPVKFVVSASEQVSGWTAQLTEFKVFFFNITHLIYRDTDGNTRRADRRVGGFLGSFENAFDFDNPANNAHTFRVYVNRKQPQEDPILPSGTQVRYEIVSGADKVEFAPPCPGSTCTVSYGTNVTIRPKSGVGPDDLPFSATVKATLLLPVTYGNTTYSFALKDATFTKTWVGTNLRIQKSGPRILTWTGTDLSPEDVTLPARDAEVGKTYTYTITVTNTGSATANNVVINENLPAELGFVSASAGGTYDPVLHKVTWDETGLPALASIPPGGSVSVTVTVYARHKPGMSWNDKDGDTTTDNDNDFGEPGYYHPSRPPAYGEDTPYPDPYPVLNRAEVRGSNTPFRAVDYELWVVRPFMEVEKRALVSQVYVGDAIPYTITVTNVDRAELGDPGYQYLKATYPGEYAQEMTLYNVTLRDLFAEGLDYVNSSPVGTLDENGKTVTWELDDLAVGQATQVRLWLRGALAGDWENCARGYANNLNQFLYDPELPYPRWVEWPTQLEPASDDVIDPRPSAAYDLETDNPDSVGNFLQSCVTVRVLPRAAEYILSITTLGEYTNPADGPGTAADPAPSGTPYWYLFTLRGDGPGSQTNVTLTVNFPVSNITYNGAVQVAISTDNGATWTTVPSASYVANWASPTLTIQYLPSLPPGALLRFSVRAVGTATDSVSAFGSSTQVPLTATVTENTNIRP